MMKMGNSCKKN